MWCGAAPYKRCHHLCNKKGENSKFVFSVILYIVSYMLCFNQLVSVAPKGNTKTIEHFIQQGNVYSSKLKSFKAKKKERRLNTVLCRLDSAYKIIYVFYSLWQDVCLIRFNWPSLLVKSKQLGLKMRTENDHLWDDVNRKQRRQS